MFHISYIGYTVFVCLCVAVLANFGGSRGWFDFSLSALWSRDLSPRDVLCSTDLKEILHSFCCFRCCLFVGFAVVLAVLYGFSASVWPCSLFVLLTCSFLTSKFGQKKIMIFLAKFDRFLIPKKVTEPNGCRFSLTFESRLRRRGVRRAQWLHVFPQKWKTLVSILLSVLDRFWVPTPTAHFLIMLLSLLIRLRGPEVEICLCFLVVLCWLVGSRGRFRFPCGREVPG